MNQKITPVELSYYGLYLLSYLREHHPDKAADTAFVAARADHVAEVFEQARREGHLPESAQELAMAALMEGLHFSKHDTLVEVLWNEFADDVPQSVALAVALTPQPYMEGIFVLYPLSNDFACLPEYELLCTELTSAIAIHFEENSI